MKKDEVQLRPFNPDNIYVPSVYVIANKDGFIQLKLPEAGQKKYKISFFEMDGKKLFTINNIPESDLVIDKANFIHAGWSPGSSFTKTKSLKNEIRCCFSAIFNDSFVAGFCATGINCCVAPLYFKAARSRPEASAHLCKSPDHSTSESATGC